jgi:hypothetical protein
LALQEACSFTDGNDTLHSFLDSSIVYKCEGGFYSASQILTHKDNNKDYIWGLMVLLALGLYNGFQYLYISNRSDFTNASSY